MRKISVIIANRHSTSICLEDEFYDALRQIAANQQRSINDLITEIDANRTETNLSSAVRIYILKQFIGN